MPKFIDLFAGTGGIRIPFDELGYKCVFTSEWDKFAQETYEANFGEKPYGDITQISVDTVPSHDSLLAGFPCQPFSNAGKNLVLKILEGHYSLILQELLKNINPVFSFWRM